MKKLILWIACMVVILGGCSVFAKSNASKAGLEVKVTSNPEHAKVNEPVKITASITNNGVAVSKNAEVKFDIIKKDGAAIGTVNPDNVGEGKYQIETIFDEEGVYQIIPHASLGNSHAMPVFELTVLP